MENANFAVKRFQVSGNRFFALLICVFLCLCVNSVFAQGIKKPNVSGAFYPSNPKVLRQQINSYLDQAVVTKIDGQIMALVSPHAGYVYSGGVAAYGYKTIKDKNYKTIIVLAPSHYYAFQGISVWPEGKFQTPLGEIKVDSEFAERIIKASNIANFAPEAFSREHALEVQLPFIQVVQKNARIVPVVMGRCSLADLENLASTLHEIIGSRKDVLVIASTDLSHYHQYDEARNIDEKTIQYIERLDSQGLWDAGLDGSAELCGIYPVITTLAYAKIKGVKVKILKYANSGDVTGDLSKVVGYVSAVISKKENNPEGNEMLTLEQKKVLLKIARESMETFVKTRKRKAFSVSDPVLKREQGAFVTLTKNGELRGCIGRIIGDLPLYQAVADMAIEAAVGDPRFPAVTADELKDIQLEVSVLSSLEQIDDVNKIEIGKHGIIIRQGFNSGLLLPQVATEYNWDRQTFLEHTCSKAGLPYGCWKNKTAQIYIFSAEFFSEKSVNK